MALLDCTIVGDVFFDVIAQKDYWKNSFPHGGTSYLNYEVYSRGRRKSARYYQGSKMAYGMHGYAPETDGLRSPFIICSKGIEHRRLKHIATPVGIFATIAALLNVDIPWPVDGSPLTSLP